MAQWYVDLMESERGWGQKLEETRTFDSYEEAIDFVKEFNAQNNLPEVPDWYMYASDPYQRTLQ